MTRASFLSVFIVTTVTTVAVAGCSRDPQAVAQRHVETGDRYVAEGKIKEAILEYRNAVKAMPRSADAQYKLARAYSASDDPVRAYEAYARTADLNPKQIDAHINAGTLLFVAGEYAEAKAVSIRHSRPHGRRGEPSATIAVSASRQARRFAGQLRSRRARPRPGLRSPTICGRWATQEAPRRHFGRRSR
jgi:Tfp pilus assembly protein PilF